MHRLVVTQYSSQFLCLQFKEKMKLLQFVSFANPHFRISLFNTFLSMWVRLVRFFIGLFIFPAPNDLHNNILGYHTRLLSHPIFWYIYKVCLVSANI